MRGLKTVSKEISNTDMEKDQLSAFLEHPSNDPLFHQALIVILQSIVSQLEQQNKILAQLANAISYDVFETANPEDRPDNYQAIKNRLHRIE